MPLKARGPVIMNHRVVISVHLADSQIFQLRPYRVLICRNNYAGSICYYTFSKDLAPNASAMCVRVHGESNVFAADIIALKPC